MSAKLANHAMNTLSLPIDSPLPLLLAPCGSRVTCNPAPTDTDRDWLLLMSNDDMTPLFIALDGNGWTCGGSDIPDDANNTPPEDRFWSFTRAEDNLIITTSPTFFRRFMAATAVAKRLNLLHKQDRIALFQAVLYANDGTEMDVKP